MAEGECASANPWYLLYKRNDGSRLTIIKNLPGGGTKAELDISLSHLGEKAYGSLANALTDVHCCQEAIFLIRHRELVGACCVIVICLPLVFKISTEESARSVTDRSWEFTDGHLNDRDPVQLAVISHEHHHDVEARYGGISNVAADEFVDTRNCEVLTAVSMYKLAIARKRDRRVWVIPCRPNEEPYVVNVDVCPGLCRREGETGKFEIVQLCAGHDHLLMLDCNGNVYTAGTGSKGELGHGDLLNRAAFSVVEVLVGVKMKQVAAGGWHNVVLSESGDAYTWGWNHEGQLGFADNQVRMSSDPQLLDLSEDVTISQVACGSRHTVLLTDKGEVLCCGFNKYGQLGEHKKFGAEDLSLSRMESVGVVKHVGAVAWRTLLYV